MSDESQVRYSVTTSTPKNQRRTRKAYINIRTTAKAKNATAIHVRPYRMTYFAAAATGCTGISFTNRDSSRSPYLPREKLSGWMS